MQKWAPVIRPVVRLVYCLSLLMAACAGPTPSAIPLVSSAPAGTSARAGPSTGGIQFMVWGSGAQLEAYRALVDAYQHSHPDQMVELIGIPSEPDYQKRLAVDFAAGAPTDVIVQGYTQVTGLVSRGLLTALAPELSASRAMKPGDFSNQAIGAFVVNRQLQCLPFNASGLVVYYNQTLFQQAGLPAPRRNWTWDDFVADARALTRDTNGDGHPDQYGLGVEPTLVNLAPFVSQSRGRLVDEPTWPSELALDSPAVVSATTWLVSLQNQYHVVPDSQAELAASSDRRFVDGTLAMIIGTRASVPAYRQITAFDWDAASLPTNNGSASNVVVADGFCLTSASGHKAAARQFIEFAASPEGQTLLARSGSIVPALTSVAGSPAFLDPTAKPAHSQVYLDALAYALPMPKLENWGDIQAIADGELRQAFYGQKDVAQALDAATTRSEDFFMIRAAP